MVRRVVSYDCGVAALAMVAGITCDEARVTFITIGLDTRRPKKPFASNFTELRRALRAHAVGSKDVRVLEPAGLLND